MIRRLSWRIAALAAVLGLGACGEKPQGLGGVRSDQPAHAGVGQSQFARPGWKAGDHASWEQQLKSRAQYGQNEYSRNTN